MAWTFNGTAIAAAQSIGKEFICVANRSRATELDIKLDEEKWDVKLLHIDLSRSPYDFIQNYKAYKQLVKIIKDYEIDCIHCNTPVGGMLGRLAGKKCNVKKVIYQAHGFHFYKGAPKKNWLIYYPVEKWLAHHTDVLITINTEDYELAKAKMKLRKNGKVYYVPGVGVDLKKFGQATVDKISKRQELGIPDRATLLMSVGELNENKNHETVIRAMKDLDVYYIIAGDGGLKAHLQNVIDELGMTNRVKLLGFRNDISQLCKAADIFVMPSYREGLSVALMEAMASGLPCAVSKIRGNVDLIEDNRGGFTFDPHSVDSCKTAIEKLLALDLAALGSYNQEKIKGFSCERVQETMKEIYGI